jgi:hypothetical protein
MHVCAALAVMGSGFAMDVSLEVRMMARLNAEQIRHREALKRCAVLLTQKWHEIVIVIL